MVKLLDGNTFYDSIDKEKTVIVDFFAEWCGPCKMMAPVFEKLSEELTEIDFCKINVDTSPEIAQKYGIMSIPTFIVFYNGQPVKKQLGAMSEDDLKLLLK